MKTLRILTAAVLVSLMAGAAFAQSVSISASCSIPAIPGVNVPLVCDTSTRQDQQLVSEQRTQGLTTVQTFYAR
ncbi:MAG: hypothetical protein ACM3OC_05705 [Deltaproteobacteria bacterium]